MTEILRYKIIRFPGFVDDCLYGKPIQRQSFTKCDCTCHLPGGSLCEPLWCCPNHYRLRRIPDTKESVPKKEKKHVSRNHSKR